VARTYSIHVQLLHHLDVFNHTLHADDVAVVGIELVAVGALDEDGLSVDEHLTVLDFNAAETDGLRDDFDDVALLVLEGDGECVEVREFGAPCFDGGDGEGCGGGATAYANRGAAGGLSGGGGEGDLDDVALGGGSCDVHLQFAVPVVVDEVLMDEDVLDVCFGACIEIDLASDACEAPEVLILEIGAVAPTHDAHSDEVFLAGNEVFGQVELSLHLGVLAIAYVLAIDPHLEVGGGRTDVEVDVLSLPSGWDGDELAVRTRVVVALLDIGWVGVELRVPGIADVLVDLVAIAFELKESGHGEVHPL